VSTRDGARQRRASRSIEQPAARFDRLIPIYLGLLGLAAWVRIFTVWFAQDDFRWLERATLPLAAAPRVLSMSLYFRAMRAMFGLHPAPYHAAQLVLHLAAGWLLWSILSRRVPAWTAALAAAWFLTAPALFDSLHWISDVADSLTAALLLLAAWLLADDPPRAGRGWLSLLVYALALASKEIAVGAAPALALLQWRQAGGGRVVRTLLVIALAVGAAIPAAGAWQTGTGEPYAMHPLAALSNLPAFLTGAVLGFSAWSQFSDLAWSRMPWVQIAGWVLLAAWLAALLLRRSMLAWLGALWFWGLLAPVAMLEQHFYLYYLDCALPGLALSLAPLVPPGQPARRWIAGVGCVLLALQLAAIQARHAARLASVPLPTDFVLRRALIARNAADDLRRDESRLLPRMVLLGQQPVSASAGGTRAPQPGYRPDPWLDDNVRAALSEGEAVRLLFPQVREATFQSWLLPRDTSSAVAAYQPDGHLEVQTYAAFLGVTDMDVPVTRQEHERRAQEFLSKRLFVEARAELEAALTLAPTDPTLLLNLGALQASMGDSLSGLETLRRAVAAAPADIEALYDLGVLEWRLGRRDEARATFARLEQVAPESDLARAVRNLSSGRAK
jgi:tetratricopeptide (TPR) repeat protein